MLTTFQRTRSKSKRTKTQHQKIAGELMRKGFTTPDVLKSKFGISNPYARMNELQESGFPVSSNYSNFWSNTGLVYTLDKPDLAQRSILGAKY